MNTPKWLRALVEVVTKETLPANLTLTDSAIRVVDPAEVRLDLVFMSADGASWVLVEVQLDEDAAKARKWPLAVAALWNERGVPGDLLVITSDRAVAAWARTVGQMDGPSGTALVVRPVVVQLTGDVAESLLDPARPELAFFAAWTVHDRYGPAAQAIVERATDLIETLPDEALRRALIRAFSGCSTRSCSRSFERCRPWTRRRSPSARPSSVSARSFRPCMAGSSRHVARCVAR